MEKKSRAELVTWHCRRLSEMQMPHRHCPEGIDSLPCGAASRLVLALFLVSVSFAVGCGKTIAPAVPVPQVEVASAVQKDVPIFSEWVATRLLQEAGSDPECAWLRPGSKQHCSFTNNPFRGRFAVFRTR
jgi:hypothetical protein